MATEYTYGIENPHDRKTKLGHYITHAKNIKDAFEQGKYEGHSPEVLDREQELYAHLKVQIAAIENLDNPEINSSLRLESMFHYYDSESAKQQIMMQKDVDKLATFTEGSNGYNNLQEKIEKRMGTFKEAEGNIKSIEVTYSLSQGIAESKHVDITVTDDDLEPNQMSKDDFIAVYNGEKVKPDSQEYLSEQDMIEMAKSVRGYNGESIETKPAELMQEQPVFETQEPVQEEMDVRPRFQVQSIKGEYYAIDENLEGGKMKLVDYYKHMEEQSRLVDQIPQDERDIEDIPSAQDMSEQLELITAQGQPARNDEVLEIDNSLGDELKRA